MLLADVVDLRQDPRYGVLYPTGAVEGERHLVPAVLGPAPVHRGGLLIDVQADPAERLDDLLEAVEVDDRAGVEGDPEVGPDGRPQQPEPVFAGLHAGQAEATGGERGVDLVGAAPVPVDS